jgi:hypothetical protein
LDGFEPLLAGFSTEEVRQIFFANAQNIFNLPIS